MIEAPVFLTYLLVSLCLATYVNLLIDLIKEMRE